MVDKGGGAVTAQWADSVWEDEEVLEVDSGWWLQKILMYLMPLYASKLLRWQHLCYVQFTTLKKAELLLVTPSATILFQATVISCWDYCKSLLTDLPASFQLELALSTQNNNKCSGLHKINVYFFLWWKSARRSNQAILKEISPEYSLEGLLLKPKFQYFDHQMQRANSLEKT